ncbi:exodeoxyribonuclease VII small subunit [Marispirochaeta aestuarii]|uniref:exodeoxyribonuclease VII small subunit n=1 Tax=Marispirochaeta aestuarii TaxID=1963862 RepID=UPI002ABD398B|nr:exodeoxyribonuclease VII small subunit [Marispirochaeta aestuarii]
MKGFEKRLKRLEELSEKIHDEEVDLDEAMAFFEEGIKLARALETDLAKVERKIEILVNQADSEEEKPVLELFPELDSGKDQE